MSRIRTFLAIDIGRQVRSRCSTLIDTLSRTITGAKWVKPDTIHITLAFLGDVEDRDLIRVCRAAEKGLQVPNYPALEAQKKVSAAWLVEHSGFGKGYTAGRAGLSRKHALAIVNRGQATAADIVALKEAIQHRVEEIWGIQLHPEPVFVGF